MGSYSDGVSNDPCKSCPANSEATETGLAECPCIQNYYRAPDEKANVSCASEFLKNQVQHSKYYTSGMALAIQHFSCLSL